MRFEGLAYRAHHPGWAWAPASGEGARLHGGRLNPPGTAALYASLRPETAWLEAQQGFAFKAQPMTLCAHRVDCEDVLDLTDVGTLAAHGVSPADLGRAWADLAERGLPVPSWEVAARLRAAGAAAVLVPGFAPGAGPRDINLVFRRWAAAGPHRVVVVVDDHGRLPRDPRSWHEVDAGPRCGEGRRRRPGAASFFPFAHGGEGRPARGGYRASACVADVCLEDRDGGKRPHRLRRRNGAPVGFLAAALALGKPRVQAMPSHTPGDDHTRSRRLLEAQAGLRRRSRPPWDPWRRPLRSLPDPVEDALQPQILVHTRLFRRPAAPRPPRPLDGQGRGAARWLLQSTTPAAGPS